MLKKGAKIPVGCVIVLNAELRERVVQIVRERPGIKSEVLANLERVMPPGRASRIIDSLIESGTILVDSEHKSGEDFLCVLD